MSETIYDCFVKPEEFRALRSSQLESDLLDRDTKKPLGKRVSLEVGNPFVGRDAEDVMIPDGVSWDNATKVRLIISPELYRRVDAEKDASGRTAYGDIFVHVEF